MLPVLFRIGGLEITSFGVSMALAFLVGGWLAAAELRRNGDDPEVAWDLVFWAAIGGILGAKVYYMLLNWPETAANPWAALTSRAGLVWYGGFLGGAALVYWRIRKAGLPVLRLGDSIAPAMAMGYVVGRVGCFLVGDDYGSPTTQPWGVAFPQGAPPSTAGNLRAFGVDVPASVPDSMVMTVHPTQLYEVGLTLIIFAVLWKLRGRFAAPGVIWFLYLAMAGVERFIVEIFRAKDDRFFGAFSLAQMISVGLVLLGVAVAWRLHNGGTRAPAVAPRPAL